MRKSNIKILQMVLALIMSLVLISACTPIDVPTENSGTASTVDSSVDSSASASESESEAESSSEGSTASEETSDVQESSDLVSEDSSVDEPSVDESSEEPSDVSTEDSSEPEQSDADVSTGEYFPPAEGKVVAFTFDDGPSYITDKILDFCEEKEIKVTFFVVGNRVGPENGARIQRAISLGCEVGNHSYDHPSYTSMSASAVINDQIGRTNSIIEKYTGACPTLMRPPYGNYTKELAEKAGMNVIMWSVDTLDWSYRNTDKIVEHSYPKISSGDIILMHDLYETTYEAFVIMVDKLLAEGYQLVTVSELIGSEKLVDKTFFHGFGY